MTQISQQPATLNFNGKDYVIQELPPEAQSCLVYMQEIDSDINDLNKQLTKQQITKQGFEGLLWQYIEAHEKMIAEVEEEAAAQEKPAN